MSHAAELGTSVPLTNRISNGKLGMWIFLASEVMFFAGLIGTYIVLRVANYTEFSPEFLAKHFHKLDQNLAGFNTLVLILSSLTMAMGVDAAKRGNAAKMRNMILITALLGIVFCCVKGYEYNTKFVLGYGPHTQLFFSCYFVTTGVHLAHVILGVLPLLVCYFMSFKPGRFVTHGDETIELLGLYWHFVDLVWIFLFPLLYLVR